MISRVTLGDGDGERFAVTINDGPFDDTDYRSMRVERYAPRRDDCVERLRVFAGARELPLSALAVMSAAALRESHRSTFELGVTALTAIRHPEGRVTVPLPSPVLGTRPVEARADVARALGLRPTDLSPDLSVTVGSCGTAALLVPVSPDSVFDARFDPDAFGAIVEKARVLGALVFSIDNYNILCRWLAPDTPALADPGATTAIACAAVLLARAEKLPRVRSTTHFADAFGHSRNTAPVSLHGAAPSRESTEGSAVVARHVTPTGPSAGIEIFVRADGRRDGEVTVTALARVEAQPL